MAVLLELFVADFLVGRQYVVANLSQGLLPAPVELALHLQERANVGHLHLLAMSEHIGRTVIVHML